MKTRIVHLAKQILTDVPQSEVVDLIRVLEYYNQFNESERAKAMRFGSSAPDNERFEQEIKEGMAKAAGSKDVYQMTLTCCRLCSRIKPAK
jgi:hypothetical protein